MQTRGLVSAVADRPPNHRMSIVPRIVLLVLANCQMLVFVHLFVHVTSVESCFSMALLPGAR
jgi:hypothetical protein